MIPSVLMGLPKLVFVINQLQKLLPKDFHSFSYFFLFIFEQVKNKFHYVYMGNLYATAIITINSIYLSNKVKIH